MNMIKKMFFLLIAIPFIYGCGGQSDLQNGIACQKDGEYGRAMEFYYNAVSKNQNVDIAEKNMGDICFSENNFGEAFDHYRKSLENNVDYALDYVMQFISYSDEDVRDLVSRVLCEIRDEHAREKIFSKLSNILTSKEKSKIIDSLELVYQLEGNIDQIADQLLELFDTDDAVIKQKVIELLPRIAGIAVDKGYVEKLVALLDQDDEILKNQTILTLGNMHEFAKQALIPLLKVVVDDSNFKDQAWEAINSIGLPDKEQLKEMYEFLKDKPNDMKIMILDKFGECGGNASADIPYIMLFLNDKDDEVKQVARNTLVKIGRASPDIVPDLIGLLSNSNEEIVSRAIYELGDLGESSTDAIEPLKQIIDTTGNKDIKKLAEDALQKIQK